MSEQQTECVDCGPQQQKVEAPPPAAEMVAPDPLPLPRITIEFCDRCRWLHRASWTQTELALTFPPPAVRAITLVPLNSPETGGRFRVWLAHAGGTSLLWDRKTEGGFPELKILKQRVRDIVQPGVSLGHSDKKE